MIVNLFANYGVLSHEKYVVYTAANAHPYAKHYDYVTYELPLQVFGRLDDCGYVQVSLDGITWYDLDQVLQTRMYDIPALVFPYRKSILLTDPVFLEDGFF